jgi:hypothetical protein
MSNLYKNIECLCAQNNLNITQLCREINVSRSTLSELSAGRTKDLSSVVKRKIAQYFLVNIEFLDQENYDIPCPECGFQYSPSITGDRKKHQDRHIKWKKAVEKYGFCWNGIYRANCKSKVYDLLSDKEISLEKKITYYTALLKGYFSRAIEALDYDLNRSFEEYASAFIKQENNCFPKKGSSEYKELLKLFGEKSANLTGTYYADSKVIPCAKEPLPLNGAGTSTAAKLSEREIAVALAYRNCPAAQPSIDYILGLNQDEHQDISVAAKGGHFTAVADKAKTDSAVSEAFEELNEQIKKKY